MDNKPLDYHIPQGWVIFIFVYYFALILGGAIFVLYFLLYGIQGELSQESVREYTFYVSMLSSAMLTGVRYSQKLYKACIDGRVSFESNNKSVIIGNVLYFLLRPIYSVVFTIMFVICLIGGLKFLVGGMDCTINERMVYLSAIVSGIIGFSIGNVLDLFDVFSKEQINKII